MPSSPEPPSRSIPPIDCSDRSVHFLADQPSAIISPRGHLDRIGRTSVYDRMGDTLTKPADPGAVCDRKSAAIGVYHPRKPAVLAVRPPDQAPSVHPGFMAKLEARAYPAALQTIAA